MTAVEPINILLVDDQPAKLLSYEVILRDLGENIIKADSGRQALEKILKNDIAVMLIDVCMPDLDGFELATMIRDHPRFRSISIIFVSAISVTDIDLLRGYQYGAVDYIPVPVIPELLRAKVKVFAELFRKTRELERVNAELETRVSERTAALAEANASLERRIKERTEERERALAQVHEMQKLESLGQLTGGLAHDFNNLLMGIIGSLDYLLRKVPLDDKATRYVRGARESAERGAALTRRLLSFARKQELRPEPVQVRVLIENMSDMLQRSIGPTIEFELELEEDLEPIRVDPSQLEVAILNLALNARDAMPDGGRLIIAANRDDIASDSIILRKGRYVCLTVSDNGLGMAPDTLARCTEPFFTTKEIGKGTGLGLSSVHGLAAQSGGGIRIHSELGNGTTVQLWFPVSESAALLDNSVGPPEQPEIRHLQVLVVDDEALVAQSTGSMLEELGHTAFVASSARQAIEILRGDGKIDLVITDHAMPAMTGAALAEVIAREFPAVVVVIATGFSELATTGPQASWRLSKPYGIEELSAILSKIYGSTNVAASQA